MAASRALALMSHSSSPAFSPSSRTLSSSLFCVPMKIHIHSNCRDGLPRRRRPLNVRAASIESRVVPLTSRAPDFEVMGLLHNWDMHNTFAFDGTRRVKSIFMKVEGSIDVAALFIGASRNPFLGVVFVLPISNSTCLTAHVLLEPLSGKTWTLEEFEGYPALLVMFICNHCPFVIHLKADMVKLANAYNPKGLAVVAISSNSVKTHPQDGPELMAEEATTLGYPFPYLYDETQETAKAFGAVCTPDFFLFKKDGRRPFELAYHGQFDDSRPGNNRPITGRDLKDAIDCVLSGRPVNTIQKPSLGCSIKWHQL